MTLKQKITPCLWFDGQAEEAANFYVSIFKNSRITAVARYGDAGPGPKGGVMTVAFELDGQSFTGLNGGPMFKFTEAISNDLKRKPGSTTTGKSCPSAGRPSNAAA
jgi:predicted 3-demethylubiquinone-9 3-methyltransferase (glyoxalase superfamily)